jgi:DNA modification methylase
MKRQGVLTVQGNSVSLPLRDESVDLIITSPPYFALRSYRDDGEHYDGQIGSEPTPRAFLEALWAVMDECWRVLKPTGSAWINLGDKYAGSGGHNNNGLGTGNLGADRMRSSTLSGGKKRSLAAHMDGDVLRAAASRRNAPDRYNQAADVRPKSLMGLPWGFALGCINPEYRATFDPPREDWANLRVIRHPQWILRAEVVWQKPSALPESVQDRVRRTHEQWFHLTKQGRYYSAVDEIREAHAEASLKRYEAPFSPESTNGGKGALGSRPDYSGMLSANPLGKLPGSVWQIPSEPLLIPEVVQAHYDLPDHFAAFPQEWPRRIILGWSPPGICTRCGEGRRPVVEKDREHVQKTFYSRRKHEGGYGPEAPTHIPGRDHATITGYACACTPMEMGAVRYHSPGMGDCEPPYDACGDDEHWKERRQLVPRLAGWTPPPTRPAVVLDPFVGTGTTVGVARILGRVGIGVDLSMDYCRLACWRVFDSGHFSKSEERTNRDRQGALL